MKFCSSYEWGVRVIGAPLIDFTYVSVGGGPPPMRIGLILKYTHDTGILKFCSSYEVGCQSYRSTFDRIHLCECGSGAAFHENWAYSQIHS